ncbi:MAG: hypothetical protein P8179_09040, partial [Candidatus Thiodiazotropha sp.]
LNGIEYQAMGRPKKERKFLHVLALNGGPMTHPTTFATPFGGRRDARYLANLSRLTGCLFYFYFIFIAP